MENRCHVCLDRTQDEDCCSSCQSRVLMALVELPSLYVSLHLEFSPYTAKARTETLAARKEWKYRGVPAPMRLSLLSQGERCVQAAYEWGIYSTPLAIPREPVRPGFLLQKICCALVAGMPGVLRTREEGEKAAYLCEAFRGCQSILGISFVGASSAIRTPCPECDLRSVVSSGDGAMACRSCSTCWTKEEFDRASRN